MILQASPPITYNTKPMAVVAVGGGIYGQNSGRLCLKDIDLRCNHCRQIYPLAEMPIAFTFSVSGVTVAHGYTEMCPHCHHDHLAGDTIEVVF